MPDLGRGLAFGAAATSGRLRLVDFFTGAFFSGTFFGGAFFAGVFLPGALRGTGFLEVDFLLDLALGAAGLRAGEDFFLDAVGFFDADFFAGRFDEAPAGLRAADLLLAGALRAAVFVRFVLLAAVLRLLAGICASRPGGQHGSLSVAAAARFTEVDRRKSKLRFLARFEPRVQSPWTPEAGAGSSRPDGTYGNATGGEGDQPAARCSATTVV